jgi:hypothetical protein
MYRPGQLPGRSSVISGEWGGIAYGMFDRSTLLSYNPPEAEVGIDTDKSVECPSLI